MTLVRECGLTRLGQVLEGSIVEDDSKPHWTSAASTPHGHARVMETRVDHTWPAGLYHQQLGSHQQLCSKKALGKKVTLYLCRNSGAAKPHVVAAG